MDNQKLCPILHKRQYICYAKLEKAALAFVLQYAAVIGNQALNTALHGNMARSGGPFH